MMPSQEALLTQRKARGGGNNFLKVIGKIPLVKRRHLALTPKQK